MNKNIFLMLERMQKSLHVEEENCDPGEEITEDNVTSNLDGGEGQIQTPYAFSKAKKPRVRDSAFSEPVAETELFFKKFEAKINRIDRLSEVNYKDFKSDETLNEKQKINKSVREINAKLREVEQMIAHASRLKSEIGASSDIYWKRTAGSFLKIKERLTRLTNKIVEISG